ncbi:hypothetical protein AG0111_0g3543 [Alternaria gaisen]|uniref:Uncharacterized protein n=1 Tax=Alternaria gaisen TaxID=167740 RepID=A0ACB6FX26_9PLEO|nr:hypothetical protein AG0111_0g3543 [Alternaria gaisen]
MFLQHLLVLFYVFLAATAAMIPRVDTASLKQTAIVTSGAHASAATFVPVIARQDSLTDEHNAMDNLDSNTFVLSANDPQEPQARPVLRTNMLERSMVKCLRVAASDTKKVFMLSDMTEKEFEVYGTVAMCNRHLVLCFEDISGLYDDKVAEWDEDHPQ